MLHSFEDKNGATRLFSAGGLTRLAASRCGVPAEEWAARDDGFAHLCAAFEAARPELTAFGKLHAQGVLLDACMKAMRLSEYRRRFPQIDTLALPELVFIVAPFRTGTTFLHRLLSCDPASRWPHLWEVAYPPPVAPHLRGDARYFAEDTRIAQAEGALRVLHRANPALARLHPMAPGLPEECFGLLETSFLSHSFMFYAELPSYLGWLDSRGRSCWKAAYEIYAAGLRLLHWWYPGRRWVLKCPVHLWNLDVLQTMFPQAVFIQMHRDPMAAAGSFCRLLAAYRGAMCKQTHSASIGSQFLSYTRQVLQRAAAARRQADASRFIDLDFADLTCDPLHAAEVLYERLGIPLEPDVSANMLRFASRTRPAREAASGPAETFGLGPREVQEMFAPYDAFAETARGR